MEFRFYEELRCWKGYTAEDGPCIMAEIRFNKVNSHVLLILTPVTLEKRNGHTSVTYALFASVDKGLRKVIAKMGRYNGKQLAREFARWAPAASAAAELLLTDRAAAEAMIAAEEAREMPLLKPVWKGDPAESAALMTAELRNRPRCSRRRDYGLHRPESGRGGRSMKHTEEVIQDLLARYRREAAGPGPIWAAAAQSIVRILEAGPAEEAATQLAGLAETFKDMAVACFYEGAAIGLMEAMLADKQEAEV